MRLGGGGGAGAVLLPHVPPEPRGPPRCEPPGGGALCSGGGGIGGPFTCETVRCGGGGRVDGGGGILGGPGGVGSGRELVSVGGRGALVRDDAGRVGKPLLAPAAWSDDGGRTGGRIGGPPTCPPYRPGPGPLLVAVSLPPALFCGGKGGGGCTTPFTRRPTDTPDQCS